MRQLLYTMFISNNRPSFHLWWKKNLGKHQKVLKYYENDCSLNLIWSLFLLDQFICVLASYLTFFRSSHSRVYCKKDILKNFAKFTGKHLWQSLPFFAGWHFQLAQVFSCEFCEIFKNTFLHRTPPVAASDF